MTTEGRGEERREEKRRRWECRKEELSRDQRRKQERKSIVKQFLGRLRLVILKSHSYATSKQKICSANRFPEVPPSDQHQNFSGFW